MTSTESESRGCPVIDFQCSPPRDPDHSFVERLDNLRREYDVFRSSEAQGYWVFARHDLIVEAMQQTEIFSSGAGTPPTIVDPPVKWIPVMLDPPEHTKWRRLLVGYFSPARVASLEAPMRERCIGLIERFAERGECDFVAEFAQEFPTSVFLEILGLPLAEMDRYMAWERRILQPDAETDADFADMTTAIGEVLEEFGRLIKLRRAQPLAAGADIISAALDWKVDGVPVPDEDLQACFLLLFMAGLDTVTSQMSLILRYLAETPELRMRIVKEPSSATPATEELTRYFAITRAGRKVLKDVDFHGYKLHAGDIVYMPLGFASRDETVYDRATEVDIDREAFRNVSFGAGPHRCLGAHLARKEIAIMLEEWHRLIPEYRIRDGYKPVEHSGQVFGLDGLELVWDVPV